MPLFVGGIGAQILTMDLAAANQACELIARLDAAGPGVGVLIDAHLVECWRIHPVEPVSDIGELKGAAIPDHCASGPTLAHRENRQYQGEKTRRSCHHCQEKSSRSHFLISIWCW